MGLCPETVQGGRENSRRPLTNNVLTDVFRIGFRWRSGSQKREIRQNFGEFWLWPVKDLTCR